MRYTPMRCTPMRYTPMRCMLMRYTPMRYTPMRYTSRRYTPVRCTPMRCAPCEMHVYDGMTRGRQSWQLIAELSILAVNCGTVTFFPTHKLLGRKKVKILPTTICYLRIFEARWRP